MSVHLYKKDQEGPVKVLSCGLESQQFALPKGVEFDYISQHKVLKGVQSRTPGIYRLRTAEAEVFKDFTSYGSFESGEVVPETCIRLTTEKAEDGKELMLQILAGTIEPDVSYEAEQASATTPAPTD